MKDYKLLIYKTLDNELINSWKNLWGKSKYANFFNSYEFFLTCVNSFNEDFEVFCLRRSKEPVIILPLIKKRVFGFSTYINPGGRFLEKSPLLIMDNDKRALKKLIDSISEKSNLRLSELPKDISDSLRSVYPGALVSIISVNPYIDLTKDPLGQIPKEEINKIRNRSTKYEDKIKHLHLRNNLKKAIKVVFDVEGASYKKTMKKEIFNDRLSRRFFKNLASICRKFVIIDFLSFEDCPFVSTTGIVCRDSYYAYHTSYVRNYKYFVPGKAILFFVLNELKSEGIKIFDFGRGLSNFKEEFTKNYLFQYDFYLSKHNFINFWWKFINFIRRVRILFIKTQNSKDYLFLFKSL